MNLVILVVLGVLLFIGGSGFAAVSYLRTLPPKPVAAPAGTAPPPPVPAPTAPHVKEPDPWSGVPEQAPRAITDERPEITSVGRRVLDALGLSPARTEVLLMRLEFRWLSAQAVDQPKARYLSLLLAELYVESPGLLNDDDQRVAIQDALAGVFAHDGEACGLIWPLEGERFDDLRHRASPMPAGERRLQVTRLLCCGFEVGTFLEKAWVDVRDERSAIKGALVRRA